MSSERPPASQASLETLPLSSLISLAAGNNQRFVEGVAIVDTLLRRAQRRYRPTRRSTLDAIPDRISRVLHGQG
jgi:hypothetical protein